MDVERSRFFANQVELVPAIGYGLGRYDPVYEEGNVDHAIGLGRWTGNRNQEFFLRLLADGRVDPRQVAPVVIGVSEAPKAYELLQTPERPPTVVIGYGRPV
jgi:threonine dehydrogenase-like Zn-dependent dehydrogenase